MKVRELIEELQKHDLEMEVEICTGGFECDPTERPVELFEFEHKNWKYERDNYGHTKYIPLPSETRLRFWEKV